MKQNFFLIPHSTIFESENVAKQRIYALSYVRFSIIWNLIDRKSVKSDEEREIREWEVQPLGSSNLVEKNDGTETITTDCICGGNINKIEGTGATGSFLCRKHSHR